MLYNQRDSRWTGGGYLTATKLIKARKHNFVAREVGIILREEYWGNQSVFSIKRFSFWRRMAGCLSHHYWKWHLILATKSTQEKVLKPYLCHRGTSFHISVSLSGLQVPMGQLWSRRNSSLGAMWVAFRLTRNWWLLKQKPVFRSSVDLKTDVNKSTQHAQPLCSTTLDMELLPSFSRWIELWGNSLLHSTVGRKQFLKNPPWN